MFIPWEIETRVRPIAIHMSLPIKASEGRDHLCSLNVRSGREEKEKENNKTKNKSKKA